MDRQSQSTKLQNNVQFTMYLESLQCVRKRDASEEANS